MDFGKFMQVLINNNHDIVEIVNKLGGLPNILSVAPQLLAIWKTIADQAVQAQRQGHDTARTFAHIHKQIQKGQTP